ncbi:MAG: ABC transporter substrate-binding protein [Deltaproteobacteria bacterium]|nr:ABC transporter substrate-binding protein [Deltaproteobacteria bacterium]
MPRRAITLAALCFSLAFAARAEPAQRVVSLNPSLTAMALALGARAQLVGVDDFSARQEPAARDLTRVGGLYDSSLEAVVALRPDLVMLVPSAEQRSFQEQLAALGIRRFVADPTSYDEVLATIRAVGSELGREREAAARVAQLRAARERAEAASARRPRVRALLVLQRDPLFVAGAGTFVDDMLRAAGADNIATELPGTWPRGSREWLLAAKPEVILDSTDEPEPAAEFWARWPSLRARVVSLPAGAVTLPGPYLDRALALIEAALHPQTAAAP